jgi:hypothetical protein
VNASSAAGRISQQSHGHRWRNTRATPRIGLFGIACIAAVTLFTASTWAQDKLADTMQIVRDDIRAGQR